MSWVWNAPIELDAHRCRPPRDASFGHPIGGSVGDLWRCTCGELWRVGLACAVCDRRGESFHHGMHAVGHAWRRATFWQRIRNFAKGRTSA
ncbi:hypothetical protein ACWDA3_25920 [Nonomuraea rubra]